MYVYFGSEQCVFKKLYGATLNLKPCLKCEKLNFVKQKRVEQICLKGISWIIMRNKILVWDASKLYIQVLFFICSIGMNYYDFPFCLVTDEDGDDIRCRWAEDAQQECGGICLAFWGATLDEVGFQNFNSACSRT